MCIHDETFDSGRYGAGSRGGPAIRSRFVRLSRLLALVAFLVLSTFLAACGDRGVSGGTRAGTDGFTVADADSWTVDDETTSAAGDVREREEDEGLAPPEPVVSREDALAVTMEKILETVDDWGRSSEAELFAEPIEAGQEIRPMLDEDARVLVETPSWLVFLDDAPGALYEHPVRYLLVPLDGSAPVEIDAASPPVVVGAQEEPATISVVPSSVSDGESLLARADHRNDGGHAPLGEHGDAPEVDPEFRKEDEPFYPVRFESDGARTESCGLLRLGPKCSDEAGVLDRDDPDGGANLIDQDYDDGVFWMKFNEREHDAVIHRLVARIYVSSSPAAPGTQYLNVLADIDGDGSWTGEDEWVVRNHESHHPPGTEDALEVMEVRIEDGEREPARPGWLRVVLSDVPVDEGVPWVGTGSFPSGEVEDFFVRREWPEEEDVEHEQEWKPDVCGVEVNRFAMVFYGYDRNGLTRSSAATMLQLLADQGYETPSRPVPLSALGGGVDWLRRRAHCLDEVFIYVVAHGTGKEGVGGGAQMLVARNGFGNVFIRAETFYDQLGRLGACQGGKLMANECETPGQACLTTVLVESCFAGSPGADGRRLRRRQRPPGVLLQLQQGEVRDPARGRSRRPGLRPPLGQPDGPRRGRDPRGRRGHPGGADRLPGEADPGPDAEKAADAPGRRHPAELPLRLLRRRRAPDPVPGEGCVARDAARGVREARGRVCDGDQQGLHVQRRVHLPGAPGLSAGAALPARAFRPRARPLPPGAAA